MDNSPQSESRANQEEPSTIPTTPNVQLGDEESRDDEHEVKDPVGEDKAKKKRVGGGKWSEQELSALLQIVTAKGPRLSRGDWISVALEMNEQGFERTRIGCETTYKSRYPTPKGVKVESDIVAASPSMKALSSKTKRNLGHFNDFESIHSIDLGDDIEFEDYEKQRGPPAKKKAKTVPTPRARSVDQTMNDEADQQLQNPAEDPAVYTSVIKKQLGMVEHRIERLEDKKSVLMHEITACETTIATMQKDIEGKRAVLFGVEKGLGRELKARKGLADAVDAYADDYDDTADVSDAE